MPKPYYALYDLQVGRYMASGCNARTKKELKDGLISYISIDYSEGDEDWEDIQKLSVEEIASMWEFEIQKQDTPFPEEV